MYGASHHLLPRAGLALDRPVGLRARGGAHQRAHLLHRRTRADQAGERVGRPAPGGARRAVGVGPGQAGGRAPHGSQVVAVPEDDVVRRAGAQRGDRGPGGIARAHHDDRERVVRRAQRAHQLAAALPVHEPRPDDHEGRRALRDRPLRRRPARAPDLGPRGGARHAHGKRLAPGWIVVEDQDAHGVDLRGGRASLRRSRRRRHPAPTHLIGIPRRSSRRGCPPTLASLSGLAYAAAISTSRSPAPTLAPATARTAVTRPATSAASVLSIFIASRTTSGWPTSTTSPSAISTETTFPGMGAVTAPEPAAPCAPRASSPISNVHTRPATATRTRPGVRATSVRCGRPSTSNDSSSTVAPPAAVVRGPGVGRVTRWGAPSTVAAQPSPAGTRSTASVRVPTRRRVSTSAPEAPGAERLPRCRRGGATARIARRRGRPRERQGRGERRDGLVAPRPPGREVLGEEPRVRLAALEGWVREDVLQEGQVGRGAEDRRVAEGGREPCDCRGA